MREYVVVPVAAASFSEALSGGATTRCDSRPGHGAPAAQLGARNRTHRDRTAPAAGVETADPAVCERASERMAHTALDDASHRCPAALAKGRGMCGAGVHGRKLRTVRLRVAGVFPRSAHAPSSQQPGPANAAKTSSRSSLLRSTPPSHPPARPSRSASAVIASCPSRPSNPLSSRRRHRPAALPTDERRPARLCRSHLAVP